MNGKELFDASRKEQDDSTTPNSKKPLVITIRIPLYPDYPDRTLGERIKKWRLEQDLLQVDLAKKIGVSEMTIVNWEKDRAKPTRRNLGKIKEILGVESPTFNK